jgi:hypothetical protein
MTAIRLCGWQSPASRSRRLLLGQKAETRLFGQTFIAVFDEIPQAELPRLKAGEAVSIQGALKVSVFEKSGEHRANLNVTAWHVMGLRQPRREKPKMPAVETGGPYRNPPPGCTAANPKCDDANPW